MPTDDTYPPPPPMDFEEDGLDETRAPLLAHLAELRSRLLKVMFGMVLAFAVAWYFADTIFMILANPYVVVQKSLGAENVRMIYTGLHEKFVVDIKVALYAAFMVSFPWMALQLWKFVAPGLYKNERQAFVPFLWATPLLFAAGAALAYFVVVPWAWEFLLSFQQIDSGGSFTIEAEAKVNEYLALIMKLIFAFGFSFLMPVALTLMGRAGIISAQALREKRRYAIVGAFLMAAILTPPDPLSQIALGIPILLLYEVSIVLIAMTEKKRKKEQAKTPE